MILDALDQADRYASLHPGFAAGIAFLRRADLAEIPSGRHEIDGERVFTLIDHSTGRGKGAAKLEVHRRHIDIQVSLDGRELMGWRALADCRSIEAAYDDSRDVGFFSDAPEIWMPLAKGQFMVFFPQDAHAPLAGEGLLHKVVIKLAIE